MIRSLFPPCGARLLAVFAALAVLLSSAVASACPVCAAREDGGSLRWVALGAFVLSPWIVSAFVVLWIRHNISSSRKTTVVPHSEAE